MSITGRVNYSLMTLLIITALTVGKSALGLPDGGESGGEDWVNDVEENHGCYCHADEQLNQGMYSLQGIPSNYNPETTYNITLSIGDDNVERSENDNGKYGGFLAEVSEGSFVTNENYWIGGEGSYISHNDNSNNARIWVFQWIAPANGIGDAVFMIYFNVVNGEATAGDQWSYITAVSLGTPQTSSHGVLIHELGVELMQYWIGLIGLAVVLLSVLVAYVVIRGGSAHYRG